MCVPVGHTAGRGGGGKGSQCPEGWGTCKRGKDIGGVGVGEGRIQRDELCLTSEQCFPSPRKTLCSHSFLAKGRELSPGFKRNGDPKSGFN